MEYYSNYNLIIGKNTWIPVVIQKVIKYKNRYNKIGKKCDLWILSHCNIIFFSIARPIGNVQIASLGVVLIIGYVLTLIVWIIEYFFVKMFKTNLVLSIKPTLGPN